MTITAEIELVARPTGFGFDHLYILYTVKDGDTIISQQSVSGKPAVLTPWIGNANAYVADIEVIGFTYEANNPLAYDYPKPGEGAHTDRITLAEGTPENIAIILNHLSQRMSQLNKEKFDYEPLGQNSNTVANLS